MHVSCGSSSQRCKHVLIHCTVLTHLTLINAVPICLFSSVQADHIVKKPQPFCLAQQCEVVFSHKGRVFVMALLTVPLPDSKLCALLLFFPPLRSTVTPLLTIYWLSPAGSSILIGWRPHQGGFGRISFVYMLVEKPQ